MNPYLECVIETNPDAVDIAKELDEERKNGVVRGPLHGVPVLVKDVRISPYISSSLYHLSVLNCKSSKFPSEELRLLVILASLLPRSQFAKEKDTNSHLLCSL